MYWQGARSWGPRRDLPVRDPSLFLMDVKYAVSTTVPSFRSRGVPDDASGLVAQGNSVELF
jgi:hypothetical protein